MTTLEEAAYEGVSDELTDFAVYSKLAGFERKEQFKKILTNLATMEQSHYVFWKKYCPDKEFKASSLRIYLITLLRLIFGVTFAVKYLERHETDTIKKYQALTDSIPQSDRKAFDAMIADEQEHERTLEEQFQEPHLKYLSFIVLGLADALVEIAGIHAGSLGIYNSTELAGLAGIIAGAAASVAMASAAYAQAKAGFTGSAAMSAIYTGVSYFLTALLLATPYFLTKVMMYALSFSLSFGIALTAFTSFYSSVITGANFKKDFTEITSIILLATALLYIIGTIIRHFTGITV
ncbi:MAG: VIT1/CCC1 transporter family protein [Candidatus Bathyarchaeia archaeon]